MNLNYKGLINILGLQKWIDRLTTLETTVTNLPTLTGDGNGIYSSSDNIPVATLATVTEDPEGNTMDFGIGVFPSWPDMNFDGTENGFFYGKQYWGGVGFLSSNGSNVASVESYGNTVKMQIDGTNHQSSVNVSTNQVALNASSPGYTEASSLVIQNGVLVLDQTRGGLSTSAAIYVVVGDPNGQITANPGCIAIRPTGGAGATFYVKESGNNTNTGWVGK